MKQKIITTNDFLHSITDECFLNEYGCIKKEKKYHINNKYFNIEQSNFYYDNCKEKKKSLFRAKSSTLKDGGLRTKGLMKISYKNIFIENDKFKAVDYNDRQYVFNLQEKSIQYAGGSLPLVTIITVIFNGEKEIADTIKSIIKHPYPNIEYIIIDGNSKDKTLNIIEKYSDHIDYWISENDNGIYDAMNKGIDLATGEWIIFINAGDQLLTIPQESLLKQYDLVAGKVILNGTKETIFTPQFNWMLKIHNTLHHQGIFYNRKIMQYYSLEYKVFSDFDLNQKLFKQKIAIKLIDDKIAKHNLTGISNSSQFFSENYIIVKKNFSYIYIIITFIYYKYKGLLNVLSNFNYHL